MDNLTADDNFVYSCPNEVVCLLEVIVVILVSSLILFTNVMNLVILLSTPSFRNSHGYLLISLSVADLVVGCVASLSIYPSATLQGSPDSWPYGDTVCLIATYAGKLALLNSGLGLMLLSIERYIAVAHPFKYARLVTKKTTSITIALCWLITASGVSTVFAGLPLHSYVPQYYICQDFLTNLSEFSLVLIYGTFVPMMLVMLVTTVIVSRKLKQSARLRATTVSAIYSSSTSQDSHLLRGSSQRSARLSRMVKVMTIAVITHMFPFVIVLTITIVHGVKFSQVISFASYWWMISNSFFNTFIYYTKNAKFRERGHELADKFFPSCFYKIDERLVCTCRYRERSTPSTPNETPENPNIDLVALRKDHGNEVGNGIENGGFQERKGSPTESRTDQASQTAVNRL